MSIALLKRKKNQCEVEKENDHDIHKEGGVGVLTVILNQ